MKRKIRSLDFGLTHIDQFPIITTDELTSLKKYKINNIDTDLKYQKQFAKGSSANIFLGEYKEEIICIKELLKSKAIVKRYYNAFMKEIFHLSKIKHENCIELIGYYDKRGDKTLYITKFYKNGDLYSKIDRNDVMLNDSQMKMKILFQICKGLRYIHQEGYIFGDLKSLNILLDDNWNAIICDFGFLQMEKDSNVVAIPRGTIMWMSPESLKKTNPIISKKSDVWSFGVICWELFEMSKPYKGFNALDIIELVPKENLKLKVNTKWNNIIKEVMNKCLTFNVDQRGTIEEIYNILNK